MEFWGPIGHKGRRWRQLFSLRSAVNPIGRRLGASRFVSSRMAERMAIASTPAPTPKALLALVR